MTDTSKEGYPESNEGYVDPDPVGAIEVPEGARPAPVESIESDPIDPAGIPRPLGELMLESSGAPEHTGSSQELITTVPVASEDVQTEIPVRFVEPDGVDTGVTTQPDYAAFSRDATRVSLTTGGLGSTGELGNTAPRDDNGRGAKNPPLQYQKAPEVPDGTPELNPH